MSFLEFSMESMWGTIGYNRAGLIARDVRVQDPTFAYFWAGSGSS